MIWCGTYYSVAFIWDPALITGNTVCTPWPHDVNWIYQKSSHRRCSTKKIFLKDSQNSQESNCVRVSFYKSCRPGDTNTSVFLWILWIFKNTIYKTTVRLLLLLHKTFRRCPGRFLNVLCPFDILCPRGINYKDLKSLLWFSSSFRNNFS